MVHFFEQMKAKYMLAQSEIEYEPKLSEYLHFPTQTGLERQIWFRSSTAVNEK